MADDEAGAGAVELAVAYISIIPETDRFAPATRNAIKEAQLYANANPIKLKADVDVSHIQNVQVPVTAKLEVGKLKQDLRDIKGAYVDVELRSTAAERNKFVADLKARLKDRKIFVYLTPVIDEQALQQRLNNMPNGKVNIELAITQAEINRFRTELRARLAGMTVPIGLTLQGESAIRAALDQLTRDRRVNVEVDVDADTRALDKLTNLGGLGKIAGIAAAAGGGIAAIGGAAGAALGAVGALAGGIAALGPVALAAGATAAVGLQGVGDAFKALSAAEDSAGTGGAAQAKAVAAAQEQVQTAIEGVADAQRSLSDAQKDAEDATKDIAQAYKEAADELEDYQLKLKDAALSEKEAAFAVKEAMKDVNDAKTPEEREKALLRLERANLRYAESQEKNRDTQEEASEAERKGVEHSDKVIAAKERAAEADQKVEDAQRALTKAYDQVSKAQQAAADAASSSSGAQDKAAQELAKLAPSAREFVLASRDLKPAWDAIVGDPTQQALFQGSAQGITDLATKAMPILGAGMVDVATSMNGLTHQFADFWSQAQNLKGVEAIFAGTASFIDGMGPGLQQMTTGILSIGSAFAPVAEQVGAQFGSLFGNIGQAFTDALNDGSLTQLMSTFGGVIQGLGEGLNPLISGLIEMGNIVGPTLGPLFVALGNAVKEMAPSLGALGATFVTTLTGIMPSVTQLITALAEGLQPVLPVIGDLIKALVPAITPLIGPLAQVATVIGTALADALVALAPAMAPLGQAFASLITAIAPMLPVIAQIAAGLIQALAPALTTLFTALAPVIQQAATAFLPVFEQLAPILADVAMQIGTALADAITQIAPYIPDIAESFGDLILAIAPLLPQLVQIAIDLLPPLLELFIAMIPQILDLMDAFTWLVKNVLEPLVIPAIRMFADQLGSSMENAANAITWVRDKMSSAAEAIGGFFSGLGETMKSVWNDIVRYIAIAIRSVGELLQDVPTFRIPGVVDLSSVGGVGDSMVAWASAHGAAAGGVATGAGIARPVKGGRRVQGPGTGTSDSILAMLGGRPIALSNNEFISTAQAYENGAPLLWALNQGWVPSPEFLSMLTGINVPGFAGGGIPGKNFAQSMDPVPYEMGGFSRKSIDCSGMVAATVNDALGMNPFSGRMSTMNEGAWLKAKGAKPGLGGPGDIAVAWYDRGGGANGHTAMRLPDGTGVESRGGDGVVVGAGATPVTSSMFDQQMHIPAALLKGGDLGGPATGMNAKPGGAGAPAGGGTGGAPGGGGTGGSGGAPGGGGAAGGGAGAAADQRVYVTNWPAGSFTQSPAASPETAPTATPSVTTPASTNPATTAATEEQAKPWWQAETPQAAAEQLGQAVQKVDIPNRAGQALADFGNANLDQLLGDIGLRKSGGAIQALVSAIYDAMADAAAAEVAKQQQQQQRGVGAFAGMR